MKKNKQSLEETFSIRDVLISLWFFIAQDKRKYVLFTAILLCALAYEFVPPFLIGKMITFLSDYTKGSSLLPLVYTIGFLVISNSVVAIVRLQSKNILYDISINARYRAKVWGFEKLLAFSLSWHQKETTGNKAQRILTGSESIREWTRDFCNTILPTIISFIGTTITCVILSPISLIFFTWFIGVFFAIELWFDRQIEVLSDKINRSMENASGTFIESTSNILSVKALGAESTMSTSVANREEIARLQFQARHRLGFRKWMFFQVHSSLSWGMFLTGIAYAVLSGRIDVGMILTFTMYFGTMRSNVAQFVEQLQIMIERKSNLCRMMPFFKAEINRSNGTEKFPDDWETISFDSVSFKYDNKLILDKLMLTIARNEKLGIAGQSGSGKSTIVKLLLGLYESESGSIRFGNKESTTITYEEITSHVAVVLQETELFNISIKDNITMLKNIDTSLYEKACQIACIDELLSRLPCGDQTLLGEKGYTLSGGERQRIGIARAICRNSDIILLDEATSALDTTTEKNIMDAIMGPFSEGKTIIMIAHRISTLENADRIVVFKEGKIINEGTHAEVFSVGRDLDA